MSVRGVPPASAPVRAAVQATAGALRLRRLLRCGHILGSLLRELLEEFDLGDSLPGSLTRTQFCLLKLCTVNPELPLSEVARHLGVTPAAMTKNADKLERLGLASRSVRAADRRSIVLAASRAGTDLVRCYEAFKESRIAPAIARLDPAAVDDLCGRLESLCVEMVRGGPARERCSIRCAGYSDSDCPVAREIGGCALEPQEAPEAAAEPGRTA